MGSHKLKAVRDASQTERERPLRADMEANQEYCIHGYSLSSWLIWESLLGFLWLVVLKFHFLRQECGCRNGLWVRFWFAYLGYQGIRATSVYWLPCLITLTLPIIHLSQFLSGQTARGIRGISPDHWFCPHAFVTSAQVMVLALPSQLLPSKAIKGFYLKAPKWFEEEREAEVGIKQKEKKMHSHMMEIYREFCHGSKEFFKNFSVRGNTHTHTHTHHTYTNVSRT